MNIKPTLELRKFVAPEIITGVDASLLIGRYLSHFSSRKPMIVTDPGVISQSWFDEILEEIKLISDDCIVFDEVTANPKDFEAMKGAEIFLSHGCDLLIAIGGGSPMDCAKCISIVSTNGGHILDYEGVDEINLPGPPLICIPTTAGTSADVSQFAIIIDSELMVKKAIISKKVVPDLALIDPKLLLTMGMYLTACTGMDALTHAIEAYVSNAQSTLTDIHALKAIKLIIDNIHNACKEERTIETMYQMMMGSLTAGLAFSNASLGAVHAMAHSLGGLLDLPHGECNSILLQHVIEINYSSASQRYNQIGEIMGIDLNSTDEEIKEALIGKIDQLRQSLNIKATIHLENLSDEIINNLVENALNDPCMITNPRNLLSHEVRNIYDRILKTG